MWYPAECHLCIDLFNYGIKVKDQRSEVLSLPACLCVCLQTDVPPSGSPVCWCACVSLLTYLWPACAWAPASTCRPIGPCASEQSRCDPPKMGPSFFSLQSSCDFLLLASVWTSHCSHLRVMAERARPALNGMFLQKGINKLWDLVFRSDFNYSCLPCPCCCC